MVDLSISDTKATGGGCCGGAGCGCGHSATDAAATPVATATCDCGPDCTCGCQEGKPCTCGEAANTTAEGTTASYTVAGMTCGHCVKAVTEEVSAIPGVSDVQVDLESGRLTFSSDAPVDFDRIVEAVAEAGDYTVA